MRALLLAALLGSVLSVPAQAAPAERVVAASGRCAGFTPVGRFSCVHPEGDLYDEAAATRWAGVAAATAPVPCYGDGTTGPRVQLIYGYAAGRPNNAVAVTKLLRVAIAPRMQAVINAAAAGKDLGIRFAFNPGCAGISVPVVRFPASTEKGTPEQRFGVMIDTLQGLGYTRNDRKYQVIFDGFTTEGVCGLGELMPDMDQPHPANVHDGVPTVGARTDPLSSVGGVPLPRYSAVWRSTFTARGPSCWELGQSKARVQVHELFHTLGAVQLSAPHSDGGGHCADTPSVMCPTQRKPLVKACATQPVEVLDCGLDDYWNPAPAAGSYLDSRENVARSTYFGPQPQDRLAASPA